MKAKAEAKKNCCNGITSNYHTSGQWHRTHYLGSIKAWAVFRAVMANSKPKKYWALSSASVNQACCSVVNGVGLIYSCQGSVSLSTSDAPCWKPLSCANSAVFAAKNFSALREGKKCVTKQLHFGMKHLKKYLFFLCLVAKCFLPHKQLKSLIWATSHE